MTFGGTPATIVAAWPSSITVKAPAHAAGTVHVLISAGSENATLMNGYQYVGAAASIPTLSVPMLLLLILGIAAFGVLRS